MRAKSARAFMCASLIAVLVVLPTRVVIGSGLRPSSTASSIVSAAEGELGVQYCLGGGDTSGPTSTGCSSGTGFDCSGLVLYSVFKGTGVNDHPKRQRVFIENDSTRVDGQSAAGALVFATEPGLLVDRARALASLSR